ncbi:hypothetical protein JYG23_00095 [Sedimentibacter sp. zth1]|uniref:hypothetical protein n=1 Tax=Sedimentibacter sp. zth1 TaxID=2816908 RepID=UPI001A91BB69|nr:hypothetical protein [Sedimentibacter sp. zth1]QSX05908.1 hypothetical protein JYG23_00095 [Sedimentibacter sp. zth1]
MNSKNVDADINKLNISEINKKLRINTYKIKLSLVELEVRGLIYRKSMLNYRYPWLKNTIPPWFIKRCP